MCSANGDDLNVRLGACDPGQPIDEQARLSMALECGGVVLWETDIEAGAITVSELLLHQLHYPIERLTRPFEEWREFFHENDWQIAWDAINDCITGKCSEFVTQYRMKAADNSLRWYQARGNLVRDQFCKVVKVIGASVDISSQKASELQLMRIYEHSRKERDRTLLAQKMAGVGLWEVDIIQQTIAVDANYAAMIGYKFQEKRLSYEGWRRHMPEGEFERIAEQVNRCLRGETQEFEVQYRKFHRDGSLRHYRCRGVAIRDQAGRPTGALGASVDNTESENRLAEAAEREMLYRNFVEHLPAGAVMVSGEQIYINRAIEKITGYSRSELATLTDWFRLLHPGKAFEMRSYYDLEREAHDARRGIVEIIERNGKVRQLSFAAYEQGGVDIWVLRDITTSNRNARLLAQSEKISSGGGWELDCLTGELFWTHGMYRLHETTPDEARITRDRAVELFLPEYRDQVKLALEEARLNCKPWDFEAEKMTMRGNRFWVRSIGIPEQVDGRVVRIYGAVVDITGQKKRQPDVNGKQRPGNLRLAGGTDAPAT